MINAANRMNGTNYAGGAEGVNNEILNGVMKMINDHSRVDNSIAKKPKSKNAQKHPLDSSNEHIDNLDKAIAGFVYSIKDLIAEEVKKSGQVDAKSKKKNKITKDIADDIRCMYLLGSTYEEIRQKYNINAGTVYQQVRKIFDIEPVNKNAGFKARAKYILLKEIIREMNKRRKTYLVMEVKRYCEYRHFVKGMPWKKAVVTPIEYIKRDAMLAEMFNEILAEFRATDKYYANKVRIRIK